MKAQSNDWAFFLFKRINIFFQKPEQALPGLVLLGLGIGAFYWFKNSKHIKD